jgi:hypothetical protein
MGRRVVRSEQPAAADGRPRSRAPRFPSGRHADAGIVVADLGAIAMRQAIAVTVDPTVPDPGRSDASVALAAEGWMTARRPSRSLIPKHRLGCLYDHDTTTRHHRRERRMHRRPRRRPVSLQPRRARLRRAGLSRRLIEPPSRASLLPRREREAKAGGRQVRAHLPAAAPRGETLPRWTVSLRSGRLSSTFGRLGVLMLDRVTERRRAAQLARHYRDQEGLPIAEIARRVGRAQATIKSYI